MTNVPPLVTFAGGMPTLANSLLEASTSITTLVIDPADPQPPTFVATFGPLADDTTWPVVSATAAPGAPTTGVGSTAWPGAAAIAPAQGHPPERFPTLPEALPVAAIPSAASVPQGVVFIDPSATAAGDGSAAHPYASWSLVSLIPGSIYLQRAGTVVEGAVVLRGEGTEAAPIVIGSYGAGAPPVVRGSIVIEQSAHLTISDFIVEGSPYPGVIVRDGAHHITIAGNTIQDNGLGVWFGVGSGGGNLVDNNIIRGNATHGIAFDKTDHRGDPTMVANNTVDKNGCNGMEINANGVMVMGNTVNDNGHLIPGSSGIHIHGGVGGADGFGCDNVIANNTVTDTREAGLGCDGNGIQLDQFTARNIVMGNNASGNDGAGIILYDSTSNLVSGNTLSNNALDRSNTNPWRAELVLAGEDRFDLAGGTVLAGNHVTLRATDVYGLWMDAASADNMNHVGGNTFAPTQAGAVQAWDGAAFLSTSPGGDVWLS